MKSDPCNAYILYMLCIHTNIHCYIQPYLQYMHAVYTFYKPILDTYLLTHTLAHRIILRPQVRECAGGSFAARRHLQKGST